MSKAKYVHPFTDFGFKKIFGEQEALGSLRDFLNTILPEEYAIQALKFRKNEVAGRTQSDRKAVFDIQCESSDGTIFIVELQKQEQKYFKDRSLYYTTFPIQEQAVRGNWNFKVMPVFCIGILDFRFDSEQREEVIHEIRLKDQHTTVFMEKLNFYYLEIPNFQKPIEECESMRDKWLYILKNLPELTMTVYSKAR